MDKQSILQACTVEGNVVKLPPGQLDRKLYQDVAKSLELIGGKWKGNKVMGFVFETDPTELLEQIAGGECRNLKKEFQFFETPDEIADWLVELAEITPLARTLEPSAGRGAILKAIWRKIPGKVVSVCEIMPINISVLQKMPCVGIVGNDFLKTYKKDEYDIVIANPPFAKNQDIDHIRKMYEVCAPGGRIVSMASPHWQIGPEKKCTDFREWLDELGATIHEVPAGAFKKSGTVIATNIIVINKK